MADFEQCHDFQNTTRLSAHSWRWVNFSSKCYFISDIQSKSATFTADLTGIFHKGVYSNSFFLFEMSKVNNDPAHNILEKIFHLIVNSIQRRMPLIMVSCRENCVISIFLAGILCIHCFIENGSRSNKFHVRTDTRTCYS